jgi:hypothetical protein
MHRSVVACCLLALLFLTGCGEKGPGLVPVKGKITYGGGPWPNATGKVNFTPLEPAAGFPRLGGTADLAQDGSFTVKSTGENKYGLVPGKYRINIENWEVMPSMEPGAPKEKSYIPAGFQPPEVEIKVDEKSKNVSFDVPKP